MATNGNDMLRYATFAVCAVIVGVYASNNTALKNGLAASEAKNASVVAETVRLKAEIAESSGKAAVFSCADPSVTVSQSGTGAGASVTFAVP